MSKDRKLVTGVSMLVNEKNVPQEYRDELDAITDNIMKVKGEKFLLHVKYRLNLDSLISLLKQNTSLDDGVDPKVFALMLKDLITQLIASHAVALGLGPDDDTEAVKMMAAFHSVVQAMERVQNRKKG